MKLSTITKIKRKQYRHKPGIAEQTGFPSPATHYLEPTIDLHQELIRHADATFFVRVEENACPDLHIYKGAVLIIDRSLPASTGRVALVVKDGEFSILRISKEPQQSFILWGVITYIINKTV